MKGRSIAFAIGLGLVAGLFPPEPAGAQKMMHIGNGQLKTRPAHGLRVFKFGRLVHGPRRKGLPRVRFTIFDLPEQTLFPPYYEAHRPWVQRPDMASRLEGGKTVEQGSVHASRIPPGRTVEGGSVYASRIKGGKSVEGGSRWAGRIEAGKTVEQGSRWASTMANWRFSGYAAPVRPRGIPYYRAPWASRLD